jgi:predicted phage-related endonuclease
MSSLVINTAAQGTPEWLAARVGHITGSRAADIVARRKDGKPTAAYYDYLTQLVAERLTGTSQEVTTVTPWMQRGSDLEPAARSALEQALDSPIFEIGFVALPGSKVGCSVDGYLNGSLQEGIVELKCPKPTTHLRYLQDDNIPEDYRPQVLHNMWVTGAQRAVFASFCPQLPAHLQLVIRRVEVTEWMSEMTDYVAQVDAFNGLVDDKVEYWRNYGADK